MNLASRESPFHAAVHRDHPLTCFFALAYAFSWAFWLPVAFAGPGSFDSAPSTTLHYIGALGPMAAAIFMTAIAGDRPALTRLVRRSSSGGRWLIIAILIPALLFFISTQVVTLAYETPIEWRSTGTSPGAPAVARPLYWLANIVFYGYGEEIGWRGFALPRLQSRFSALRASVVLAAVWAGWHLPLFAFSSGLANLGLAGAVGWLVSLLLGSILLTWLLNSSGGSIAAVALLHAGLDIFISSPVSPHLPHVMGACLTVGTLLLIPIFGPENLARRQRVIDPPPAGNHSRGTSLEAEVGF